MAKQKRAHGYASAGALRRQADNAFAQLLKEQRREALRQEQARQHEAPRAVQPVEPREGNRSNPGRRRGGGSHGRQ